MPKIVLASASPRRKMLLEQLGLDFEIVVSSVEEIVDENSTPEEVVKSLAYQKAQDVAKDFKGENLVIGSDTIVVIGDRILGKPKDEKDIYEMLRLLSGKTHRVMTGVCMINTANGKYLLECDTSYIKFREINDAEIDAYIRSEEPFGKAGSYAIQGLGSVFVEKIEGSYTGIVGLPVFTVAEMLKHFGIEILR